MCYLGKPYMLWLQLLPWVNDSGSACPWTGGQAGKNWKSAHLKRASTLSSNSMHFMFSSNQCSGILAVECLSRKRHYSNKFFHTRNRKGQMAAAAALASEGSAMFSFYGNCITISKCHEDKCSSQPQFNTLQLCTAFRWSSTLRVCVCV